MSSAYVYRKPVRRLKYAAFRRQLGLSILVIAPFVAVGVYIYLGYRSGSHPKPVTSGVENTQISANKVTTLNDYFQFQDSGPWVLDKKDSTANLFTYDFYNKSVLEHVLTIYMNQVPIPLYLAVPRVLPVRIINNNSFQVTNVSDPCGQSYARGELHKVKEVTIANTTMLCDPDSPQYSVVLGEVNGDYRLNLKRPNGSPVQFVILYKDVSLDTRPDSLLNVASSFQTR
jgi:hypothetical protein